MKELKEELAKLRAITAKLILTSALSLSYYFWRFATKRNPDVAYAYLDALYKMSFGKEMKIKSQPKPEPKQAQQ